MQAHLVKLGLLSLAGAPDMPKITLRKGAKAEPGTEMDTILRNVLGDPDEAEAGAPADARDEQADAEAPGEPAEAKQAEEPAGCRAEGRGRGAARRRAVRANAKRRPHPKGPTPQLPPVPRRYRYENLQDLVDDLLKSLDE